MIATEAPGGPEPWRVVWRGLVVGSMPRPALCHLLRALQTNDPRLLRGANTEPPVGLIFPGDDPGECRGACLLAFALWQALGLVRAAEVDAAFQDLLAAVGLRAGSKLAILPLLDWIDCAPWGAVRMELMGEISLALAPPIPSAAVTRN
jgi:hypothetical protein